MRKTKVDQAIGLITSFKKSEVLEFQHRLFREHSVIVGLSVPIGKVAEPIMGGYWLKEEADKRKR